MDSKVAFRPGDKLVVSLLNDLDHLKTQKDIRPIPRARLTEALIRSCARLMREHSADHLIVTSALWVLVSLVRMDAGARGLLSDAGVPGVLAEILHGSRVSRTTREYAGELTKVLWYCSPIALLPLN